LIKFLRNINISIITIIISDNHQNIFLYEAMIYYKMDSLSMITSVIIEIKNLLIFLSPFMLGWIGYSYIFSKLIYSFSKRYLNLNISFSRTLAITSLSGITSFIIFIFTIIIYLFFLPFSYYIDITIIILEIFTAILIAVFITSLIAYKFLSNANLRVAIFMSFATFFAYIIFNIIALFLYIIFLPPQSACCA